MKVLVYVEGPSDRAALSALLRPVIDEGQRNGIGIKFLPLGGKAHILEEVPRKAADYLSDNPQDLIVALPDLYPMKGYDGTPNAHRSFGQLKALLRGRFEERAGEIGLPQDVYARFVVHCLKHDLEALLLAAPDQLRLRLKTKDQLEKWQKPVEDQDDDKPPKRIVEALFNKYRKKPGYIDTSDAPWILSRADLASLEAACPQRFRPFVAELRQAVGSA